MAWEFEPVAGPFDFTEGPVWDGTGVLFTDIPSSRIMRYSVETGECTVYRDETNGTNGLKLNHDGDLFGCQMVGRQVVRFDADGGTTVIADSYRGDRLNSPNDLAIDSDGEIWFTDPHYGSYWEPEDKTLELDHRSVYRVHPEAPGELTRVTFDTTNPNGVLLAPDEDWLYVAQSDYDGLLEFRRYPVLDGKKLGEFESLHDFSPHRAIDGMCFDAEGNIVATAGYAEGGPGPMVYVFSPAGEVLETHETPDPKPTNCAFGDHDLQTLYVTGSEGYLYRVRTDRTGYLGAP